MKKIALHPQPVQTKRRRLVKLAGGSILFLILTLTFLSFSPLSHGLDQDFNPWLPFSSNLIQNPDPLENLAEQQATAIATYYHQNDGYDPYSNSQTASDGYASLHWPVGQCTYWANYKYHADTGHWVSWSGNAYQWVSGAQRAGWVVSHAPHVSSIIVLMPGVQGASHYGHVAVVQNILNSANVQTSNMNWYANGGGFNRVSLANFTVGPGVYFIWHP